MIFTQTIARLRAPMAITDGGAPQADWSAEPDHLLIQDCSVQPRAGQEDASDLGDPRLIFMAVYTSPGDVPDITSTDRVWWAGHAWEVDGPVRAFPDPFTGEPHHLEFTIKRTEGA
jgi:hypothetical protein